MIESPQKILTLLERLTKKSAPLFATLATVGPDNTACARTVVLRGISDNVAWLSAHARSEKVAHLRTHPDAELAIWLPENQVQLRLRATWRVIDATIASRNPTFAEIRAEAWNHHSPASREMFDWPAPGQIIKRQRHAIPAPPQQEPAHDFAILLGAINFIDALLLAKPIHKRYRHERRRQSWHSTRITP